MSTKLDALIIGGGFGGVDSLIRLRKAGFKAKIVEASPILGGTWSLNRYPGARVDSPIPLYCLDHEEIWEDFTWSEVYPGWKGIRHFFNHADKKMQISKDAYFNTRVSKATWNEKSKTWHVEAMGKDGKLTFEANFLISCLGFASAPMNPFEGAETFKGQIFHTGNWDESVAPADLTGKRIGVIGTGASGVQVAQELGKVASEFKLFQRTPNLCLPMGQAQLTPEAQVAFKAVYADILEKRRHTFAGFHYDFDTTTDWRKQTPEQREAFFEKIWAKRGFTYWLGTYQDVYFNEEINREAYNFWQRKVAERVTDPKKRELLAPKEPFHTFGTRRPSLEQDYYEVLNDARTEIIDVRSDPIVRIVEKGVQLKSGRVVELDVLVCATGFDTHSGVYRKIDITGVKGQKLADKWSLQNGVSSNLGMTIRGFPNLFYLYGAQAPTAYSNGPSTIDIQAKWLTQTMEHMREKSIASFDVTPEAEKAWCDRVEELSAKSLFHASQGWYMGRNVKGKKAQPLNYTGGIPAYIKDLEECAAQGYKGFILSH